MNKKNLRRIKMLVRRNLRLLSKGKSYYDKANEALALAINNGLAVGNEPIELEILGADGRPQKEQFELVNNFAGEVAYRPARVPHYELKKVPKYKRAPKVESAPTAEAAS
jgi:hypothetical protein